MTSTTAARRDRLVAIGAALPEAEVSGEEHLAFRVRRRTFAYYLNNHHGDGKVAVCFKTAPGDQALLIAHDPEHFYMPAYLGPKGWVALRLDLPEIGWEQVARLLTTSYRLVAPKRLAALVPIPKA